MQSRGGPSDSEVTALARQIAEMGGGRRAPVVESSWWSERMLEWAMAHPSFKTQLFRFVDVFPATTDDRDVVRHLAEYLDGSDAPRVVDLGLEAAEHLPFGPAAAASMARRNVTRIALQFIAGADPRAALASLHQLWTAGSAFTVDLLGEKTLTAPEADEYARRVGDLIEVLTAATAAWAPDDHLDGDDLGPLPRVNVSLKASALATRYAPLNSEEGLEEAKSRLRPILMAAQRAGAFVNVDAEHYDVKALGLRLLRELLEEPDLATLEVGAVVQAYLKDAFEDLGALIELSARRQAPLTVRLVKGAYWDAETIQARAAGWAVPVFSRKVETDANYERCTRLLHDHHGEVRAAFGSHNLRSLAYAIAYGRSRGIPDNGYEVQLLYGMAPPLHAAVRDLGMRLRVYAPVGELVPGMSYLVRRLLENTANESFIRRRFEGSDIEELLDPPLVDEIPGPEHLPRRAPTDSLHAGEYRPEPASEWRRGDVRRRFSHEVERLAADGLGRRVTAIIDGRAVETGDLLESVDPAAPSTTVAWSSSCGDREVDQALEAAQRAWPAWSRTTVAERAAVLFGAAEWMRARRERLGALEVFEAGKPWPDADADVCEAIDFCEYYGRRMLLMDSGGPVGSRPGEDNRLVYRPKGVGVVISPWNFPLAIPTGMVTAALVTGNAVLFKPAEQTPAVAAQLVEALSASGLPDGVLAFLPGVGETVGRRLVESPEIDFVAFTGSKAVGLEIVESAAIHRPGQRHVKRVVAEMGGKNAIVVDADADLDQAVPIVAESAFGYAGQKCSACSRVIVLGAVHDRFVDRLIGAVRQLVVGHPRRMGVRVGPVIDADARRRVRDYIALAADEGEVVLAVDDVPDAGWFVGPTIVTGVPAHARLAREEVFGPVLAVMRAESFDEALALANDTDYALTAGVVSRSPSHIALATTRLRAGNVYVNRVITGATVGFQPFGGYGLSGTGSKAGGPDYLMQFSEERIVSENTVRQGFAPPAG